MSTTPYDDELIELCEDLEKELEQEELIEQEV